MAITPLDIQDKEFDRAFRGYDIEDVDEFLDLIARDLEQLIRENADLKEQVNQLLEKNKNYQKLEATMHNAILVAQETADEVKQNAKHEADLIKREAEQEAKELLEQARTRTRTVLDEQEDLVKQVQVFKLRFKTFIEAQLAALNKEEWMDQPVPSKEDHEITREIDFGSTERTIGDLTPEPVVDDEPEEENNIEPELPFRDDIDTDYGLERDLDRDPDF